MHVQKIKIEMMKCSEITSIPDIDSLESISTAEGIIDFLERGKRFLEHELIERKSVYDELIEKIEESLVV